MRANITSTMNCEVNAFVEATPGKLQSGKMVYLGGQKIKKI